MTKRDTKYAEDDIIASEIKVEKSSWKIKYFENNLFLISVNILNVNTFHVMN